jgi:protein gp37
MEILLRTPTLRAGSRFRISECSKQPLGKRSRTLKFLVSIIAVMAHLSCHRKQPQAQRGLRPLRVVDRRELAPTDNSYCTLSTVSVTAFSSITKRMKSSASMSFKSLPSLRRGETPPASTSRSPKTSMYGIF